jgi:uncharacterized membrane protein
MSRSLLFILIAASAAGMWSVLISRASKLVNPVVGTGLVEASALVLVLIIVVRNRVDLTTALTPMGAALLVLCGLCVFFVDYFSLRAYEMGMSMSVGAPTVASGAILIPSVVGIALGEGVTLSKVLGIGLIGAGIFLLTHFSV